MPDSQHSLTALSARTDQALNMQLSDAAHIPGGSAAGSQSELVGKSMRPLQDPDIAVADAAVAGDIPDAGQRFATKPTASSAVQPSTDAAVHNGSDAAHGLTASWTQQAHDSFNRDAATENNSFNGDAAAVVDSNSHGNSSNTRGDNSNSHGDDNSSHSDDNNSHGRHSNSHGDENSSHNDDNDSHGHHSNSHGDYSNSHGESKGIAPNSGTDVGRSIASAVDSGTSGQARADLNSPAEQSIDPEVHSTVETSDPTQHDKADAVASFEQSRAVANLPTAQGRADASVGYTNSRLPRASLSLRHHSPPANSWALVRQLCLSCKMHACNVC